MRKCTRCQKPIEGAGYFLNEPGFDEEDLYCTKRCANAALHEFWASVDDFVAEDMAELEKEAQA